MASGEGTVRRDGEGEIVFEPNIRIRSYGRRSVQEPKLLIELARALNARFPRFEIEVDGVWMTYDPKGDDLGHHGDRPAFLPSPNGKK